MFKEVDAEFKELDVEKVLTLYQEYEALKEKQKQIDEDLKSFKEDCELAEIPFKLLQRVYTAEQKNKSSCSTVKHELSREFDTVKILENALIERET
jgi:hypothetical protein